MAWSIEERREWLFPPVSGEVDGIDLAYLNPGDHDDRTLLIALEHPVGIGSVRLAPRNDTGAEIDRGAKSPLDPNI